MVRPLYVKSDKTRCVGVIGIRGEHPFSSVAVSVMGGVSHGGTGLP